MRKWIEFQFVSQVDDELGFLSQHPFMMLIRHGLRPKLICSSPRKMKEPMHYFEKRLNQTLLSASVTSTYTAIRTPINPTPHR